MKKPNLKKINFRERRIKELQAQQKAVQRSILNFTMKLYELQAEVAVLKAQKKYQQEISNKNNNDILTTKDVCSWLEISESKLYRMRVFDNLPFIKKEGRRDVLYSRSAIERFFKDQEG